MFHTPPPYGHLPYLRGGVPAACLPIRMANCSPEVGELPARVRGMKHRPFNLCNHVDKINQQVKQIARLPFDLFFFAIKRLKCGSCPFFLLIFAHV